MAIPFLDAEKEDDHSKVIALTAIFAITVGLAYVSIYGIWATPGHIIGKIGMTPVVAGAEFLTAIAVMRAIVAPTKLRIGAACIIACGLAWYCIHNVERGVHSMYPTLFAEDAQALRDRAELRGNQAVDLKAETETAQKLLREDLALVRQNIAKLEGEQELMTARTPEGISSAQRLLQSKGLYDGVVDGKAEALTEAARREYGERVQSDIEELRQQETNMMATLSGGVVAAMASPQEDRIKLEAEARERSREGRLLVIGLWVLEGARSLGMILFVASTTVSSVSSHRGLHEEIERQKLQNQLNALRTKEPESLPEPESEPEPELDFSKVAEAVRLVAEDAEKNAAPEMTPAQRNARNAGLASGHNKAAARAAAARLIRVDSTSDWDQFDELLEAAE